MRKQIEIIITMIMGSKGRPPSGNAQEVQAFPPFGYIHVHPAPHPSQILEVKQHVLKSDVSDIAPIVRKILRYSEPEKIREQIEKLNA